MLDVIKTRRSHRKFLQKEVEPEKLEELLRAAFYAPSSKSLKPWEFIVVRHKELKEGLSRASLYSRFVKDAPLIIVICYDTTKNRRFKEDSSIAAAMISLEAENQGLGTCFVQVAEAYEADVGDTEGYVKRLLNIPNNYRVQCLLPIGYPAVKLPPKTDDEIEQHKVHNETFGSR
ncbi:MAG: nitroreductase family protein [Candidatus Magnetoovum sp. WYHC-5]|nr:nitroreductase family protein [Candidatus Magnetoovum sp. WYHC-5]